MNYAEIQEKRRTSSGWHIAREGGYSFRPALLRLRLASKGAEDRSQEKLAVRTAQHILSALWATKGDDPSEKQDFVVFKRAVNAVLEAAKEEILTRSEANAVIEYMASRFIERKLGQTIHGLVDVDVSDWYELRALKHSSRER